ncbi:MAG: NUDIX hydrolase [Candidatus Sumerlaeia bacterium]|nr:NUDIX hydrolase [Candidatus Sumerlaeia bacterium]
MAKKVPAPARRQSGVLPYRSHSKGIQVLLITSRSTGAWIVPKGNVEPYLSPRDSAMKEAWEEAGIQGEIHPKPTVLTWEYRKGDSHVAIDLFPMRVKETASIWPEFLDRKRKWMSLSKAIEKVEDPSLKGLLRTLPKMISSIKAPNSDKREKVRS